MYCNCLCVRNKKNNKNNFKKSTRSICIDSDNKKIFKYQFWRMPLIHFCFPCPHQNPTHFCFHFHPRFHYPILGSKWLTQKFTLTSKRTKHLVAQKVKIKSLLIELGFCNRSYQVFMNLLLKELFNPSSA